MDRSLLFFYGLFIVFMGYYAWKAKKQRVLTSTLWQLAALNIIKSQSAAGLNMLLHDESNHRLDWQVIYFPEQNTLEIGAV